MILAVSVVAGSSICADAIAARKLYVSFIRLVRWSSAGASCCRAELLFLRRLPDSRIQGPSYEKLTSKAIAGSANAGQTFC